MARPCRCRASRHRRPGFLGEVRGLKVGIDGRNLGFPGGTGVATYASTLARCLPGIGVRPELLRATPLRPRPLRWLSALSPLPARSRLCAPDQAWEVRAAPDLYRTAQVHFDIWSRLRVITGPALPDLMHWTYPLPLRMRGVPNIYTVHDLIPLLHPTLTGIDAGRARCMLERIVARADHLVTVSETSRRELIAQFNLDPGRVTNTWQAVDVSGAAPGPPAGLTPCNYWLHVGAVEPRKNLRRIIAAWRAGGGARPLVIAGPDGWHAADAVGDLSNDTSLIRVPWLERSELLALIRDAFALLMPSLAEGFGLPVAEAMALGTPVVTSAGGALSEIAGGAALLVDPYDTRDIAAALRQLAGDPSIQRRLIAAGRERSGLFTLSAYATRLEPLYRAIRAIPLQSA